MKSHTLTLPRHAAKGETYLAHPETLRFRNSSGKVVPAIVHPVCREELEGGQVYKLISPFQLARTEKQLAKRAGRCIFAVGGYGGDEEELYLIPEVRQYFQRVTDLWPHWLFSSCFFFPSAAVIALCNIRDLSVRRERNLVQVTYNTAAMEAFFERCLETTAVLDSRAGISRQESVQRLGFFRQIVGLPC